MSVQSKYFQVTDQVLLEYCTDEFKMLKKPTQAPNHVVYMLNALDNSQLCLTLANDSSVPFTAYPQEGTSEHYYPGTVQQLTTDITTDSVIAGTLKINDRAVGDIIKEKNGTEPFSRNVACYYDTIRIYLATGYMMNSVAGYNVRVKAHVTTVKSDATIPDTKFIDDYMTLIDWFMPKEQLKDSIHWLSQPLYFTKCYYDRYIELNVPSVFDIAENERNIDYVYEDEDGTIYRGWPNANDALLVEFSTVSDITAIESTITKYSSVFMPDTPMEIAFKRASNSKYFNVRIEEDAEEHCLVYYPTYGEEEYATDLDLSIMSAINSGAIPMIDLANIDQANEGMDDFIEIYGDDADKIFRWVIINELNITYNYANIINRENDEDTSYTYTEYYTNQIDYSGKVASQGEFWRSKFVPYAKEIPGMTCKSIIVQYTCHLYNRVNNMNITRIASMIVNEPYKFQLTQINTSNVYTYKVINKVTKEDVTIGAPTENTVEKYIKSYFNVTNILMKTVDGQLYADGQMTLRLHRTNSNYLLKLYNTSSDNTRVPMNLAGAYKYKLVFPGINGKIAISPNTDSTDYNLGNGSLIFYITGAMASQIMSIPASERYFAVMTDIENGDNYESTLYEGKVEWIA